MTVNACPKDVPIYNLKAGSEEEAVANAQLDFAAPEGAVCRIGDKYYLKDAMTYTRQTGKQPTTEKEKLIDKIEKGRMDLAFGLGKMAETKGLLDRARLILSKGDAPSPWLKFAAGVAASSLNFGVVVPAFQDAGTSLQIFLNKRWGIGNGLETSEAFNELLKSKNCVASGSPVSSKLKKGIVPLVGLTTGGILLYAQNSKGDETNDTKGMNLKDLDQAASSGKSDEKSPIPDRDKLEKMSLDELKAVDKQVKNLTGKMTKWQEKYATELKESNDTILAKGLGGDSNWMKDLAVPVELGLGFGIGSHYGARLFNVIKPYGNWMNKGVEGLQENAQGKAMEQFEKLKSQGFVQCTEKPVEQTAPETSTDSQLSMNDPGVRAVELLTAGKIIHSGVQAVSAGETITAVGTATVEVVETGGMLGVAATACGFFALVFDLSSSRFSLFGREDNGA